MRKIIYSKDLASYFYIQLVDGKLLIVSMGADNPFEFMDVLGETIQKEANRIDKDEVPVYFDLLSCVGKGENRRLRLTFNKKSPNTFINEVINLSDRDLPFDVSHALNKFYAEHLNEALRYSVLSNKEKKTLSSSVP